MNELGMVRDLEKGWLRNRRGGKGWWTRLEGDGFSHFCTRAVANAAKTFGRRVEGVDFYSVDAGFGSAGYEQGEHEAVG